MAKAMLNPDAEGYDDAPWLWSDQYQHNIQILGIPQPGSRTIVREDALYFAGRKRAPDAAGGVQRCAHRQAGEALDGGRAGFIRRAARRPDFFTDVIAIANPHP